MRPSKTFSSESLQRSKVRLHHEKKMNNPNRRKSSERDGYNLGLDNNLRTEKPRSKNSEEECANGVADIVVEGQSHLNAQQSKKPSLSCPRALPRRTFSSEGPNRSAFNSSNQQPADDEDDGSSSTISDMMRGTVDMWHKPQKRWSLNHRLGTDEDDDDMDESEKGHCIIEDIKGKFGTPKQAGMKPKWTTSRRTSLSSMGSLCSQASLAHPFPAAASASAETTTGQDDPYRSSSTLPVTNLVKTNEMKKRHRVIKTEQMIESLVWFSFHIPRTILEDLIQHELDQWQDQSAFSSVGGGSRHSSLHMRLDEHLPSEDAPEDAASVSSLSADETAIAEQQQVFGTTKCNGRRNMLALPTSYERKSALLFVDMSGFTKLSRLLDVESLSKVINTYFDMIASEVIMYGGDILKFAGDAFFAEWRVLDDDDEQSKSTMAKNPLSDLNASLVSICERAFDNSDIPPLSNCVLLAAKCGASIVKKFSDYQVTTANGGTSNESMLNVHCGIGAGNLVGLHVGDYRADVEESVELRREFLLLGEPIDQVSLAADVATDGQLLASPKAMELLTYCCDLTDEQSLSHKPVCIAARGKCFLQFDVGIEEGPGSASLQPFESLRIHCQSLRYSALQRLNLQMALYVHPVIRADELALSAAIRAGKISQPTETLESRHRAEAELRSVYTMFISPQIKPRITGMKLVDNDLFRKLNDIMYVTSRELDRYSGHLRQFIVDDKGVVLIATFGLRGSTFPNMVENNCLPATFSIQRSLKSELGVETKIGATFGKVYCGVVGGVRRHEFACMGAPVNLAARLMSSKVNKGILVDEAVREQCQGGRFAFKDLPPVEAKGYDRPVPILEPEPIELEPVKRTKFSIPLVGRRMEKKAIESIAKGMIEEPDVAQSTMVFITGESGVGKTALALDVMKQFQKEVQSKDSILVARSTSTETEQRIPLSSFRKLLISVMKTKRSEGSDGRRHSFSEQSSFHPKSQRHSKVTQDGTNSMRSIASTKKPKRVGQFGTLSQSVHGVLSQSIHSGKSTSKSITQPSPSAEVSNALRRQSKSLYRQKSGIAAITSTYGSLLEEDSTSGSYGSEFSLKQTSTAIYFEQICWACGELDYPFEYADIVGSQFLGFEEASAVTHVDGYVPSMDELVEFLALVFVKLTDSSKLVMAFIDDFQWADAFSWRVLRVVCKRASNVLLMCATRSHDKQALRRITNAASPEGETQSQMIEVSLGPFDFTDIKELIAYVLDQKKTAISNNLCAEIFQMTGGVPVYSVQLLENLKRTQELHMVDGELTWKDSDRSLKKSAVPMKNGAMMEEAFLSRFDCLDVRVRKVLQSCAVWGLSFELGDVASIHQEMKEEDIEEALDAAVDEMILTENIEDHDEDGTAEKSAESELANNSQGVIEEAKRVFQFSHSMWRKNVLATMLKERKGELHRLIAESIERGNVLILQDGDISQLLTLLDHWKSCGEFCKVAPLALAAGVRLEEWELPAQSLELYEDALEMVFGGVQTAEDDGDDPDWVKVKAKPVVLDLILRLHVCAALSHQRLGAEMESILLFEDAYNVMKTASKLPRPTRALSMPIISSLCVLKLEYNGEFDESTVDLEDLIKCFMDEAETNGTAIHVGRSLSMWAVYQARLGELSSALSTINELLVAYDVAYSHDEMVEEYGRDFAVDSLAESCQWLYLLGRLDEAEDRANDFLAKHFDLLDPDDLDAMMHSLFPVLQVLVLLGKAKEAKDLFQEHVALPFQANRDLAEYWIALFRPFMNLMELVLMDESGSHNKLTLRSMENWALDENIEAYPEDLRTRICTVAGEICWRLSKHSGSRAECLVERARELLVPVARYEHDEAFQKHLAQALLDTIKGSL